MEIALTLLGFINKGGSYLNKLSMKKLKLKALEFGAKEVLTRVQLKHVLGGSGSGSDAPRFWDCNATNSQGQNVHYSVPENEQSSAQTWYNFWAAAGGSPTCTLVQTQWA